MSMMPRAVGRRSIVGGLLVSPALGQGASAAESAGKVETARGECYAQAGSARRTLEPASAVFIGDAVATGVKSALAMRLGAATEIKLGAEARLRIDRFLINAGGVLMLERGVMLYDHDAQGRPAEVAVRTTFGLLAVRGTRFFAGPSNGVFGVFVERGAVMVVGVNTSVLVTDGLGTNIDRPGAEPTPPAKWGAARIASAMASVS